MKCPDTATRRRRLRNDENRDTPPPPAWPVRLTISTLPHRVSLDTAPLILRAAISLWFIAHPVVVDRTSRLMRRAMDALGKGVWVTCSKKIGLSSLAVGGLLAVAGCSKSGAGAQSAPLPQVNVAQVVERRVKDWDEFTGRFQAVESVEIRPRVSGYIDEVAFKEGGQVKRGDLLFVIDPRPYQAEYDRAAADLKRYKTALDLARIESVRVQR